MNQYEASFPTNMPIQAARDLWRWARKGELVANKADAALAAWNVIGYGAGLAVGGQAVIGDEQASQEPEFLFDELGESCDDQLTTEEPVAQAVSPLVWITVAKWVLEVLLPRILK